MLKNFVSNVYYCFATSASDEQRNPTGGAGFGMVNADNDKPWYPYYVHAMIGQNLAKGDTLVSSSSSSDDLRTVAWIHGQTLNTLLILKVNQQRTIALNGLTGKVNYTKIDSSIPWTTSMVQTGTIDTSGSIIMNGYTVLLLQDEAPTAAGYLFQDNFETGSFGKWTSTSTTTGETATVSTLHPHHGSYHGRFTSNAGNQIESAYSIAKIYGSDVYARGYFYLTRGLPLDDNEDRLYFIRFTVNGQSLAGAGIRRISGVDSWVIYARDGATLVGPASAQSPSPQNGRWYCIELHLKSSSTQGQVQLYVDGTKILEISNINTASLDNPDAVDFGLISAMNIQHSVIVYGDCFICSSKYVGPETG
jgi:hypothetical protein